MNEPGIIFIKNGENKAGLYLTRGMHPLLIGSTILNFCKKLDNENFFNSFKEYMNSIEIVKERTIISENNRKYLTKLDANDNWVNMYSKYEDSPNIPIESLLESKFNQITDVSKFFINEDCSEMEYINHIYEIDLNNKEFIYKVGGLMYNFNWEVSHKIKFSELDENNETNLNNLVADLASTLQS